MEEVSVRSTNSSERDVEANKPPIPRHQRETQSLEVGQAGLEAARAVGSFGGVAIIDIVFNGFKIDVPALIAAGLKTGAVEQVGGVYYGALTVVIDSYGGKLHGWFAKEFAGFKQKIVNSLNMDLSNAKAFITKEGKIMIEMQDGSGQTRVPDAKKLPKVLNISEREACKLTGQGAPWYKNPHFWYGDVLWDNVICIGLPMIAGGLAGLAVSYIPKTTIEDEEPRMALEVAAGKMAALVTRYGLLGAQKLYNHYNKPQGYAQLQEAVCDQSGQYTADKICTGVVVPTYNP